MSDAQNIRLDRLPAVKGRLGRCRSSLYQDIAKGTFVPPVSIGARAVAWPSHEIDEIVSAKIAGYSNDQMRELVAELVAKRVRRV